MSWVQTTLLQCFYIISFSYGKCVFLIDLKQFHLYSYLPCKPMFGKKHGQCGAWFHLFQEELRLASSDKTPGLAACFSQQMVYFL